MESFQLQLHLGSLLSGRGERETEGGNLCWCVWYLPSTSHCIQCMKPSVSCMYTFKQTHGLLVQTQSVFWCGGAAADRSIATVGNDCCDSAGPLGADPGTSPQTHHGLCSSSVHYLCWGGFFFPSFLFCVEAVKKGFRITHNEVMTLCSLYTRKDIFISLTKFFSSITFDFTHHSSEDDIFPPLYFYNF